MKRTTVWLLMTLLTFILGVAAVFLYLKFNGSDEQRTGKTTNLAPVNNAKENAEIQTLSFCDLSSNPEEYDGKVVRITAAVEFGLEGAWFSDSGCRKSVTTLVFIKNEEVNEPIDKARNEKNDRYRANKINVTVIGEFKNQDPQNCCIIASSQFEIQKVEKASKIIKKE